MRTTTLEPVRRLEAAGFFVAAFRRCVGLRAAVLRTVLRAGLRVVLRTVLRAAGLRVLRAVVLRAGRRVVLRTGFFVALVLRVRVFLVFFFAVAISLLLFYALFRSLLGRSAGLNELAWACVFGQTRLPSTYFRTTTPFGPPRSTFRGAPVCDPILAKS